MYSGAIIVWDVAEATDIFMYRININMLHKIQHEHLCWCIGNIGACQTNLVQRAPALGSIPRQRVSFCFALASALNRSAKLSHTRQQMKSPRSYPLLWYNLADVIVIWRYKNVI